MVEEYGMMKEKRDLLSTMVAHTLSMFVDILIVKLEERKISLIMESIEKLMIIGGSYINGEVLSERQWPAKPLK